MKEPLISVILPVYNAENYLRQSIDSILSQTFTQFELIIINDGSTDGSQRIIDSCNDARIVKVKQENIGLADTLNKGIAMARAPIIARQDNDDISLPQRLQMQYDFLNKHSDVALVGAMADIINEQGGPTGRSHRHPQKNIELKFFLLFNNPFVHSLVMFRKRVVQDLGGYSNDPLVFEDYNLWSRLARQHKIANLPDVLLNYREVNTGMSKTTGNYAQKAFNQSFGNLKYYYPAITEKWAQALFGCYKGNYAAPIGRMLAKVAKALCNKEIAEISELRGMLEAKKRELRQIEFNRVIHMQGSTALAKLLARLHRRWLILTDQY